MLAGDESDWWQVVRDEHAGTIKQEVQAFVGENLRVGAGEIAMTASTVDTFDEYVKKSRGKTCTLCSRGVAAGGNLGPMKSSKSLTTLQSGFSNREMIGGTKRDNLFCVRPAVSSSHFVKRQLVAEAMDGFFPSRPGLFLYTILMAALLTAYQPVYW